MSTAKKRPNKSARVKRDGSWAILIRLISELDAAARADEMKGGGDPQDYEVIELRYKLAIAELNNHIGSMRRELET